jgi:hypothetical protein
LPEEKNYIPNAKIIHFKGIQRKEKMKKTYELILEKVKKVKKGDENE